MHRLSLERRRSWTCAARSWTIALALLIAGVATPAGAVELRRLASDVLVRGEMRRAYAPCTAPNDLTSDGRPACAPPVSSSCDFSFIDLEISNGGGIVLDLSRRPTNDPLCRDGLYRLQSRIRATVPNSADTLCDADDCTRPESVVQGIPFQWNGLRTTIVSGLFPDLAVDGSAELRDVTLIAPDGWPMAAIAAGYDGFVNLSPAYEPCTAPAPGNDACEAVWASPCDFITGSIGFVSTGVPNLRPTLSGVSGLSPLCTSGTHSLAIEARVTLDGCGPAHDQPCTLTDTTFVKPIVANGPEIDGSASFGLGGILSAELLGLRLFDPTGALFATAAVPSVLRLTTPQVAFTKDRLRIRASFPASFGQIDAAEDDGVTMTLHDRNGAIYAVTIPGDRWQLQPPLGERWSYKDKGGVLAGTRKAGVRLTRKHGVPAGYDVRLEARGLDLSGADLPSLTLEIAIARREPAPVPGPVTARTTIACGGKGAKRTCR